MFDFLSSISICEQSNNASEFENDIKGNNDSSEDITITTSNPNPNTTTDKTQIVMFVCTLHFLYFAMINNQINACGLKQLKDSKTALQYDSSAW